MRSARRNPVAALLATAIGLATLGALATPLAVAAATSKLSLTATAPITGLGPRWSLQARFDVDDLLLIVQRKNAAGTARAYIGTRTTEAKLTCTTSLKRCVLSDEASLGKYGAVEMAFSATGPRTSKELRCPGSSAIRAIEYKRNGLLSGKLKLDTKMDLIGVVKAGAGAHRIPASIPATVTKVVRTEATCPDETAPACPETFTLVGGGLEATQRVGGGSTRVRWHDTLGASVPDVYRFQVIEAKAPAGSLTVNSASSMNSATLEITGGAPFIDGGALYAAGEPKEDVIALTCSTVQKRDGGILPSVTVAFPWIASFDFDDQTSAALYHTID